eukprot:4450420-Lingulodinium_polyedra.AAC.1
MERWMNGWVDPFDRSFGQLTVRSMVRWSIDRSIARTMERWIDRLIDSRSARRCTRTRALYRNNWRAPSDRGRCIFICWGCVRRP